jgi:hypothetical protein
MATDDLEVNQAVRMQCAERPCVAEHNTIVRARIMYNDPKYNGLTGAVAQLHVLDSNGTPIANSPFSNDPQAPPLKVLPVGSYAEAEIQRNGHDTLNFRFLESLNNQLPEGTYDIYLTINPVDPHSPPAAGDASDPLNRAKNLVTALKVQRFVLSAARLRIAVIIDPNLYNEKAVVNGRVTTVGPQIVDHILNRGFSVLKAVFPISASRFSHSLTRVGLSFAQLPAARIVSRICSARLIVRHKLCST